MLDAAAAYRALAPAVLGYFRAQRAPEPEDLVGEVFLQVARDADRFSGDFEELRRWVFTIACHRLIDSRRRQGRRPLVSTHEVPDGAAPAAQAIQLDPELQAALLALTDDQREVVVLRFVADLSLESVATVTRRPVGAVKAMQHRALDSLARILSARSVAEPGNG